MHATCRAVLTMLGLLATTGAPLTSRADARTIKRASVRLRSPVPIEPATQRVLDLMEAANLPPLFSGTPEEARASYRQVSLTGVDPAQLPQLASIHDTSIPGPHGDIPIRIYDRGGSGPRPTIVFFHGGGWMIGDLDTHDKITRRLAADVDAVVVAVDYKLAPEFPFPYAFEECYAATLHVLRNPAAFGGSQQVAVAGDSSGGNLAAAVALAARDAGLELAAQLLVYPGTDQVNRYPSFEENADGRLDTDGIEIALRAYAQGADKHDPRLSPMLAANHSGLAPAIVAVAGYDPLRDDGLAYATKLSEAGVPVIVQRAEGLIHGFYGMYLVSPGAEIAVARMHADLRSILSAS